MRTPRAFRPLVLGLLVAGVVAACAHGPQPIGLHPAPVVTRSAVGAGIPLAVTVVDRRTDPGATELPSAARARARFPLEGDVTDAVRAALLKGLKAQGFRTDAPEGYPALTVAVTRFDYWVLSGFGTSDIRATVVLEAVARRADASFNVTYKAGNHQRVAVVPRQVDVQDTVNGALAAALQRLLADDQVLRFLAADS